MTLSSNCRKSPSPKTSHAGTNFGGPLQSPDGFATSSANSSRASMRVKPTSALTLRRRSRRTTLRISFLNASGTTPFLHTKNGNLPIGFSLISSFHSGTLMSSSVTSSAFLGLRSFSIAAQTSFTPYDRNSTSSPCACHIVNAIVSISTLVITFSTLQLSATSCASSFSRVGIARTETVTGNQLFVAPNRMGRSFSLQSEKLSASYPRCG